MVPELLVLLEMESAMVLEPVKVMEPSLMIPEPLFPKVLTLLRVKLPEEISAIYRALLISRLLRMIVEPETSKPEWELKLRVVL